MASIFEVSLKVGLTLSAKEGKGGDLEPLLFGLYKRLYIGMVKIEPHIKRINWILDIKKAFKHFGIFENHRKEEVLTVFPNGVFFLHNL